MPLDQATLVSLGAMLPPSMHVFMRIDERMRDPLVDVSDLVALIRVDPSLSFKLLRLANSVMYGSGTPCDTLDEAVSRVGLREVQRLVGLAAVHQTYQHDLANYHFTAQQVWENAVATAVSFEALSSVSNGRIDGGYVAGLMRNLGRLILDRVRGRTPYPGEAVAPDVAAWEFANFGTDGPEVGARLLEHWRFPPEVVTMVRGQLAPLAQGFANAGVARLNLAGHLATRMGVGLPGESTVWSPEPEKLVLAGIDAAGLDAAFELAREPFQRVRQAFMALKSAA